MIVRPSKDEYFLTKAWATRRRSTCVRRATGAVLVNGLGHDVGSGYNGRPSGYEHCNQSAMQLCSDMPARDKYIHDYEESGFGPISKLNDIGQFEVTFYPHACRGAFAPVGSKPASCEAIHAELNALNQCYDRMYIDTCYVTRSPCIATCLKALLQTSCRRIVFAEKSSDHDLAREMWLRNNGKKINAMIPSKRVWDHVNVPDPFSVIDQLKREQARK